MMCRALGRTGLQVSVLGLGSGGQNRLGQKTYTFVAAQDGVGSVLTGTANPEHLVANARAVEGPPLTAELTRRVMETFGPVGRNASHPDFA
jgi:aryl-alcohol dehydrogenase-like predicted oxidoreductase